MTGILQNRIIEIGKENGFVTIDDLRMLYSKNIQLEMNKLIVRGFFEQPIDDGVKVKWKYNGD